MKLTKRDIIRIHRKTLKPDDEWGILSEPQLNRVVKEFNREKDVYYKVAILLDGIANKDNQLFIDGNKRTALSIAVNYLEEENIYLTATNDEIEEFMISVVSGMSLVDIVDWIEENTEGEEYE